MSEGFANVNGARLWYEELGDTSRPAVTFVHAGICDHRQWDGQVAAFAAAYRVVRFDMRGFGQSDLPPGPVSLSDDIRGLLDALGIERTALIGCSMGGSASIDCTLRYPDRVAVLVTVGAGISGSPPELGPGEEALIAELTEADKAHDDERLNALELRLWVDGPNRSPEQVDRAVRALVADMNGANIKRSVEWEQTQPEPLDPPALGRLGEIHAPTLVIVGSDDTFNARKAADQLTSGIAGARKYVMDGLTHVPNMERPDEFNKVTLDFLSSIW